MRIAIFAETFLPKWDGIANTLCHLLEHLAGRGHASLMFAPEGAPSRYADTEIVGLPSFSLPFYPDLRLVPPLFNVEQELAAFKPDLVHVVNPAFLGLVGMRHARDLGLPVAASYHTDLPGYLAHYGLSLFRNPLWAYFRWIHNAADVNFCPSNYTKAQLEAHAFERLKVWGRGVDTVQFHPRHRSDEWRHRLTGGHPDAPLLLYVGRLAMEKRVDWLRPVLDVLPRARLAIVGDGPFLEDLEELFAGTPTVFTGYLQGLDLARAYAAGDLFLFPSATETFGNVVLEAMASGLPVIAPRSGGPVDHVFDGENGFLFAPDDQADLVALAWRCVSDLDYARRLGARAHAYAATQTWERVLDGLLKDYEELVASHHPGERLPARSEERAPEVQRELVPHL
jgi:glycosyltransferase involved in cell wall biosynthesis